MSPMEYDDIDPDDPIGSITIHQDLTVDYEFCCGDGGKYRTGPSPDPSLPHSTAFGLLQPVEGPKHRNGPAALGRIRGVGATR
jgi:hypothetical protein